MLTSGNREEKLAAAALLDEINRTVQRLQREAGRSFVSRTRLKTGQNPWQEMVVLRAVIMNPLTTREHLQELMMTLREKGEELLR